KNDTVLNIAFRCGFNSKSTFNRVFKESFGLSPSEFRKKSPNS
ncbi:MAG: AraC family transcriptional regulator, partial [Leptospiraceae bacterium]|nr:AraC family transcriptional regulator [Leptospiraceae bacterium]